MDKMDLCAENTLGNAMTLEESQTAVSERWPAVSDAAVRLAAHLRATFPQGHSVIAFAGAVSGEGVTHTVGQVARALSQMEVGPILLVDANLRSPRLHFLFRVQQSPGLLDVVQGKAKLEDAIHPTIVPHVSVISTGETKTDSHSVLSLPGWPSLVRAVRERFSFVIMDSSPVLSFVDSALIAPLADAVVLVIASGERRHQELMEVKRLLGGLRANLLGVLLSEKAPVNPPASTNGHSR